MKTLTRMHTIINALLSGSEGSNAQFRWFQRGWLPSTLIAFLMAGGLAPRAFSQDQAAAATPTTVANVPTPAPLSNNRFLFVLDTSSGMKRYADKEREAVESILRSGFNGQLHAGDSIGVWTFNDDVHTGHLGLQQWTPGDSEEIVQRTSDFLRHQKFEKNSQFDLAMSAVNKIVKLSDVITVVVISDGKNPITQTPFDNDINPIYLQNLQESKKNPAPMVTVLQGKGGQFTKLYSVAALPWPVVIPELPISMKMAKAPGNPAAPAVATTPVPAPKAPARPAPQGPSMVLVGPQPPEFPMSVPASAPGVSPAADQTARQTTSLSEPSPVVLASVPPVPAEVPPVMSSSSSVVSAAPPSVSASSPDSSSHAYTPPPRAASQPPIAPASEPMPPLATSIMVQSPMPAPAPTKSVTAPESPVKPAVSVAENAAPAATIAKPAAPAATTAPVRPVVASQPGWLSRSFTSLSGTSWMIGAACLLVLGVTLTALFSRRSNGASRVSLISQTMNK